MSSSFYSYLDSYEKITLIIPKAIYKKENTYKLEGNDEVIDLIINETIDLGDEMKVVTNFDAYLMLESPYYVVSGDDNKSYLKMGKIVRSSLFDSIYHYKKNDLGYTYTKESTKFKIWAPTAKEVTLELVSPEGDKEFIPSEYRSQGIHRTIVDKDIEGYKYRYHVNVNGESKITIDPYAISTDANATYAYVVDKNRFYKMKPYHRRKDDNVVIYETSIWDFTSSFKDDPERSTYSAFTKDYKTDLGSDAGLKYLKKLGVTHIQLMPMYLFGDVDETDRYKKYNWGYNPVAYNTPSGMYTLNPSDPYKRINELKEMVERIHDAGLKVVMDVVYNHVYDVDSFPFEILCPGYMYVYNREGMRTNSSGCGNDINSSKSMVREFIINSVNYWLNEFDLDGFRFDLMGLIDFETMNDIAMGIHEAYPSVLIYGEGWKMVEYNRADNLAHMYNKNVVSEIGFFNDRFRNSIKDYALGVTYSKPDIEKCILGSCINKYLFKYAHQSINYTECHDNMTLFDWVEKYGKDEQIKSVKDRCILSLSMTILSAGIPFMHSGMEFFRSKEGLDNSYNVKGEANVIHWNDIDENRKYIDFVRKLIYIRKKYNISKFDNPTIIKENASVSFNNMDTIEYKLGSDLLVIFKNNPESEYFDMTGLKLLASSLDVSNNNTLSGIGCAVYESVKICS